MLKIGPIRAVGAMSGTSLDGVDAAEIVTDGVTIKAFGDTSYRPYNAAEKAQLKSVLGKWPTDDLGDVAELIETVHAEILYPFQDAHLIGFHGQTLAHDPSGRGTHQCGDGAVLAAVLNKPVVWDFRTADVQMGGEGAPLAPFYHFALAQWIKAKAPTAFLNLGGVGNLTWVDPTAPAPEVKGALLAFDTGPANAPINDLMQSRLQKDFDANGDLARTGTVNEDILNRFLTRSYFYKIPPKSLDRDTFQSLQTDIATLNDADAIATLTAIAAMSVVKGLEYCPTPPKHLYVTGGGRHNTTLMEMLKTTCDTTVLSVEDAGLNGDMLEAQAFAYLAVRVARGLPTSCPGTTGVRAAVSGGTISKPA